MAGLAARGRDAPRRRAQRARRFLRREVHLRRRHVGVLHARRPLLRAHRRTGRQARRVRGEVRVRRRAAAAVPDRTARRTAAGARRRVGLAAARAGRTALVPPLSRPQDQGGRCAALDRHRPELELPVRRLPLHRPAQELRRAVGHVQDRVGGSQRGLRELPRPRVESRRLGEEGGRLAALRRRHGPDGRARRASRRHVGDRCGERQRGAIEAARVESRDRGVRTLPLAARTVLRCARGGAAVPRRLPARAAGAGPLSPRRPAAGRGLHVRIVPAEPHARKGRDVLGLPRSAFDEAARVGQRGMRPVPCARALRRARASSPSAGHAGGAVHRVPHADHDLHGGRSAPRSFDAHPASGPHGVDGRAQRVQQLPSRVDGEVGGRCGDELVSAAEARVPDFRRGVRCRRPRGARRAARAARGGPRPQPVGHGARERDRAPAALPVARHARRGGRGAERSGRERAHGGGAHGRVGRSGDAPAAPAAHAR